MAENPFVNTNRHPKNNHQNNEDEVNYKRTQTIAHNPLAHGSTQPISGNDEDPPKKQKKRKKNATADSASSSATKKQKMKLFQSCAQCCRKKKATIVKSKTSFVEYLKKKSKQRGTKGTRSKQAGAATVKHPESEDKQKEKIRDKKKAKKKDKKKQQEKEDPLDPLVPGPAGLQTDPNGKLSLNQVLGMDVQDFTKSCCYLCAKNAMAIAAAISGKMERSDVSIQTSASFKESATLDKSCSPMMYVRTVQSSVKVRTRDMGTLHPEKKKNKRPKAKLNFKKRLSLIPKVKFPGHPRMRTVACETEKSMGNNNIPQCRARRGTHCVTENK